MQRAIARAPSIIPLPPERYFAAAVRPRLSFALRRFAALRCSIPRFAALSIAEIVAFTASADPAAARFVSVPSCDSTRRLRLVLVVVWRARLPADLVFAIAKNSVGGEGRGVSRDCQGTMVTPPPLCATSLPELLVFFFSPLVIGSVNSTSRGIGGAL